MKDYSELIAESYEGRNQAPPFAVRRELVAWNLYIPNGKYAAPVSLLVKMF